MAEKVEKTNSYSPMIFPAVNIYKSPFGKIVSSDSRGVFPFLELYVVYFDSFNAQKMPVTI